MFQSQPSNPCSNQPPTVTRVLYAALPRCCMPEWRHAAPACPSFQGAPSQWTRPPSSYSSIVSSRSPPSPPSAGGDFLRQITSSAADPPTSESPNDAAQHSRAGAVPLCVCTRIHPMPGPMLVTAPTLVTAHAGRGRDARYAALYTLNAAAQPALILLASRRPRGRAGGQRGAGAGRRGARSWIDPSGRVRAGARGRM